MRIYVHVPFCHSKCWYCDFYSMPCNGLTDRYTAAVAREWALRAPAENDGLAPASIYLGGGTPSILGAGGIAQILKALPKPAPEAEVTVEVNPEDVTADFVSALAGCGVNRVSMGVQSFVDSELAAVGRCHDVATAMRAIEILRDGGMANLSLDLIYGLPEQTVQSWTYSVERMMEIAPEHFSAYILSYEPGTRLTARKLAGKLQETDEDTIATMYQILCQSAKRNGYRHYEISNFSLPGKQAEHNSAYWHSEPYIGLGPGAHSFDGRSVRRANPANLRGWLQAIESGNVFYETEQESVEDMLNDRILVSLRTMDGLDLHTMPSRYADQVLQRARTLKEGLVSIDNGRIRVPEEQWLLCDEVIRELMF